MADAHDTRPSLLEGIRDPGNHDAWERFAAFYQPVICRFASLQGCTGAMCQDVAQETLVDLIRIMPTFRYDRDRGRFRSYLYQIARRRVLQAWRRQSRYVFLEPNDLAPHLPVHEDDGGTWDREWHRQVVLEALERLRECVAATSFEAFHAHMVRGEDVGSVCARLGLKPNAFYQIRHRLCALLRRIVGTIESEVEA
jgi:RNA polymerase sigma-70 factor (ECF subfamily)